MRLLLDTHTLLWWLDDNPTLGADARSAIASDRTATVSVASVWEIEIKRAHGRLIAPDDLLVAIGTASFSILPIEAAHAVRAAHLPSLHGDPFDRMLVAQAQAEGLTIVTRDERIASYGVAVLAA